MFMPGTYTGFFKFERSIEEEHKYYPAVTTTARMFDDPSMENRDISWLEPLLGSWLRPNLELLDRRQRVILGLY
jgi:hypothetical protein